MVVITTWPDGWSPHFVYAGQYYDNAVCWEPTGDTVACTMKFLC